MSVWRCPGITPTTLIVEEGYASVEFEGVEQQLPGGLDSSAPEQAALRVTQVDDKSPVGLAGLRAGDLMISVGDEPFFRGRGGGGVRGLYRWLVRELRDTPAQYPIVLWRDGRALTITASLQLGSYSSFAP